MWWYFWYFWYFWYGICPVCVISVDRSNPHDPCAPLTGRALVEHVDRLAASPPDGVLDRYCATNSTEDDPRVKADYSNRSKTSDDVLDQPEESPA